VLGGAKGRSLNMRGAFVHLATDALGSLGAMVAGVLVLGWGLNRADPAISILIGLLVVWAAWRLLADATQVLLEGAPAGMDVEGIHEAMSTATGVRDIHHVHVWNLASDVPALSAHVVLTGNPSMHEAQLQGEHLKSMLADRFGIEHVTLELECHGPAAESPP
jgi:cobalt-zinc-cadmium efflux system protein